MTDATVQQIILMIFSYQLSKSLVDHLDCSCAIDIEWDDDNIVDDAVDDQAELISIGSIDNFLS